MLILTCVIRKEGGENMVSVNVPRVRGKMAEKGYNLTSMADALHITRDTMRNYLNNPAKMPYGVVVNMAEMLCDDAAEATTIFFAEDLRGA